MALDTTKLEKVAGGQTNVWLYKSGADAAATVTGSGYFNGVTDRLKALDLIIIVPATGAVALTAVTSATGAATVTTAAANV